MLREIQISKLVLAKNNNTNAYGVILKVWSICEEYFILTIKNS